MALEFADSNRGRVTYERELSAEYGEEITNYTGQTVRLTSSALTADKGTAVSDELRSDSMVSDLIETDFSTGGDLGAEWILGGTWETFLESALRGDWGDQTTFNSDSVSVNGATDTYTGANNVIGQASPGDFLYFQGFVNDSNNGWKQVLTANGTDEVTVLAPQGFLVTETSVAQPDGVNKTIFNGVEKTSYNMEQFFPDLSTAGIAQLFLGQRVGSWSLNISAGSIVTTTWGFQGTEVLAQEGTYESNAEPGAATTTPVVGATGNVANITVDGDVVPCRVQSISLNLDNGLRVQNSVGSKFPCGIGYGRQTITGNITVYFQNLSDYTDFIDHESVAIYWDFEDADGNHMRVKLPNVKYTTGSPQLEGIDTDVMVSCDFQALARDENFVGGPRQIEIATYSVL